MSVSEHLDRTLPEHSSETFSRARHSRDCLRYVVEETLAARSEGLKGYTIAIDVLGPQESFDPTVSPVVRTLGCSLRRGLKRHRDRERGSGSRSRFQLERAFQEPHSLIGAGEAHAVA